RARRDARVPEAAQLEHARRAGAAVLLTSTIATTSAELRRSPYGVSSLSPVTGPMVYAASAAITARPRSLRAAGHGGRVPAPARARAIRVLRGWWSRRGRWRLASRARRAGPPRP